MIAVEMDGRPARQPGFATSRRCQSCIHRWNVGGDLACGAEEVEQITVREARGLAGDCGPHGTYWKDSP